MSQQSSLWQKVIKRSEQALETGALQPISTQLQRLPDQGIPFEVRILDSLNRKAAEQRREDGDPTKPYNPFLPYEEALFVDQLSESHVCLLNKFNVVDHHLLLVTREYESQAMWLTYRDFEALSLSLAEIDGLGFYNGGAEAGASQHHKHLQLIPLKLQAGTQSVPISAVIDLDRSPLDCSHELAMPFWHSLYPLPDLWTEPDLAKLGDTLLNTYHQIMVDLGLSLNTDVPNAPYNLLITRKWMMGIRRSQASYQGIGVNSLGYAGWLLVKNLTELEQLKHIGPLQLLKQVGCTKPAKRLLPSDRG